MKLKNIFLITFFVISLNANTVKGKTNHGWFYKLLHPSYRVFCLTLPDGNTDKGIKWTCFPVLDSRYTLDAVASNLLSDLLDEIYFDSPLKEDELVKRTAVNILVIKVVTDIFILTNKRQNQKLVS